MTQININSVNKQTTEKYVNNNINANSKTKIYKGEITKIIPKLYSLNLTL